MAEIDESYADRSVSLRLRQRAVPLRTSIRQTRHRGLRCGAIAEPGFGTAVPSLKIQRVLAFRLALISAGWNPGHAIIHEALLLKTGTRLDNGFNIGHYKEDCAER